MPKRWKILENIKVEKLIFWWVWLAHDSEWKKIIIKWWPLPDSVVNVKILKNRKNHSEAQIVDVVSYPDYKLEQICKQDNVCWWARWQVIPYEKQLEIKQEQVKEAFFHLEKYQNEIDFLDIEPSPDVFWYRNKMEYSFWKYISKQEWIEKHRNLGFHKQWEFSKVNDVETCCLVDDYYNSLYKKIKDFLLSEPYDVYDSFSNTGFFRHLTIRSTSFTKEVMIILSYNPDYDKEYDLSNIKAFFSTLIEEDERIKSIYLSKNERLADIAIWDLEVINWEKYIKEDLLWLSFNISPKSFFQTNSKWAEKLYSIAVDFADKELLKWETVLDLYAWTGTIWMIFSKFAKEVFSVELVESASKDWEENAKNNWINNINFINSKVEDFLKKYLEEGKKAWVLIVDPPRAWMHPSAPENLLKFEATQIIYISCNPATLARDLEVILASWKYKIEKVKAMDMFPHTHHIETVVSLKKIA